MRTIDYREINPDFALHFARESARDELCDAPEGYGTEREMKAFVSDYVNEYMSGVVTGDMADARERYVKLAEREGELIASIETVMSGPCAMVGGELSPGARHNVNYYRAQLAEVQAEMWDAREQCGLEL